MDILPVVKGLVSEHDKVKGVVNNGYDAYAVSLGKEDIVAVGIREELKEEQILEDIDIVYLHYLGRFGDTDVPSPAFSALIDSCNERSLPVSPLDMDEESYSNVYCNMIKTLELLREGRLARKAMRKRFDMSSPEAFAVSWDMFVNATKGFRELTRLREKYMANRIRLLSKDSKHMLAVVETERIKGIMSILNAGSE
ncbi:MAG: hypothetical protein LBI08_04245 [Methanomassiliicoccaceae archaeon]|nr:hypothetical protein [Methanomassiliicoccaceae archaeon]